MDKQTARRIADWLTWSRIWATLPITLCAWLGLEAWVLGLYIAAALTDMADGKFARRAAPPGRDIDFDGIADIIFSLGTLAWIWMLVPGFYEQYWFPYLPVLVLIEIYMVQVRVRWPEIRIPHFQFGRVTMTVFCFLLPVLLVFGNFPWFVHGVFVMGVASKLQLTWYLARYDKPVGETAA